MTNDLLLTFWYQALESHIGISIEVDDRRFLIRHLYSARRTSGDEALNEIMIFQPPNPKEVWLAKRGASPYA